MNEARVKEALVVTEPADAGSDHVLVLHGAVDVMRTDDLVAEGDALLRATPAGRRVAIDLSDVDFMDSSGLSGLLRLRRTAVQRGIEIRLRGVPAHVAALLRISGLEQILLPE